MRIFFSTFLALAAATSSFGSIMLLGPAEDQGAGLGNRMTVLTLQSPANATVESGCVGPGETTVNCGYPNSQVMTGEAQIGSFTIGDLGLLSLAELRIIFNAAEPGNSEGIFLNSLTLTLYNGGNSLSFDLDPDIDPLFLEATFLGVGQEGYAFALDGPQATAAEQFVGGNMNVVIGLGANLGCTDGPNCRGAATGGLDTFSLARFDLQGEEPVIPEPSTYMLLLSGLAALAGVKKFRG